MSDELYLDGYDEVLKNSYASWGAVAAPDPSRINIRECDPAVGKTNEVGPKTILSTESPHSSDTMEYRTITPGAVVKETELEVPKENIALQALQADPHKTLQVIEEGIDRAETNESKTGYPNLAWEALKAGLGKEIATKSEMKKAIQKAKDHQKKIDLLLDFTAEMTKFPSDKDVQLSQEAKDILKKLKELGVKIWEGDTIPKDKVPEVKSLTASKVDKERTELQTLITTEIQLYIQNDASIMEALKTIVKENAAFIRAIIEKFTR